MRGQTWFLVLLCTALAGCTMGLGETTSFATRNLAVSGELADGAFAIEDGVVSVVAQDREPELGVLIFFDASDDEHGVQTSLEVEGNLGALCPGASVELADDNGRLVAIAVEGAPSRAMAPLMGLEMTMNTSATVPGADDEQLAAEHLVMSATEGEDGFSIMTFEGTTVVDGEQRIITGSFEIARVVEDTENPGWEGDTWNGQPITNWE